MFRTVFALYFLTEIVKTTVSKGWTPLKETVHSKDSHSDQAANVGYTKYLAANFEDTKQPAIPAVESNLAASAAPVTDCN